MRPSDLGYYQPTAWLEEAPMADVEVQTTMFANPIKVPAEEVAVLRSQGLLVEDAPGAKPAEDKPAGPAGEKPDAKESK